MKKELENALKIVSDAKKNGVHCFKVLGVENGYDWEAFTYFPRVIDVNGSEYEYNIALYEIEEDVMRLKVGESMYFRPNRDDKDSAGIILRIV